MKTFLKKVAVTALAVTTVLAPTVLQAETTQERDARMAWWREARLGMFVHWGLYSQAAGVWDGKKYWGGCEWIQNNAGIPTEEYEVALRPLFKPKADFAAEWASLAKEMGAKYVVFTSKHHEGFALHDSALTDYDAKDFCGRDLTREIVNALRKENLKVGFYHSMIDWHHPDYVAFDNTLPHPLKHERNKDKTLPVEGHDFNKYLDFLSGQVQELTLNYQPDIFWWDFSHPSAEGHHWRAKSLLTQVYNNVPGIIQNNRLYNSGNVSGDNLSIFDPSKGDFTTPEQYIPATGMPGVDWEVCMTLNGSWGYSNHDMNWKSGETIIRNTIDIVSKGGNYLLNVGPAPDGSIPEASYVRIKELGNWMKTYGSSIYGTKANPLKEVSWGRITAKGDDMLYLHVFSWPEDGCITVPLKPEGNLRSWMLADTTMRDLETEVTEDGVKIHLLSPYENPYASVVVLKAKGNVISDKK